MPRKNKPTRTPRPVAPVVCPTAEWVAKGEVITVAADLDRAGARAETTQRRVNRATRWQRDGWIDADDLRAFDAWEALNDACRWDVRAVDYSQSVRANSCGCRPESVGDARSKWGQVADDLKREFGHPMVWMVWEWLTSLDAPNYAEAFGVGRDDGRRRAMSIVRAVGSELQRLLR